MEEGTSARPAEASGMTDEGGMTKSIGKLGLTKTTKAWHAMALGFGLNVANGRLHSREDRRAQKPGRGAACMFQDPFC